MIPTILYFASISLASAAPLAKPKPAPPKPPEAAPAAKLNEQPDPKAEAASETPAQSAGAKDNPAPPGPESEAGKTPDAAADRVQFADTTPKQEAEIQWSEAPGPREGLPFAKESPQAPRLQYAAGSSSARPVQKEDPSAAILRKRVKGYQPSPQRVGISFKMGPYLPDVDRGKNDGPYRRVFGEYQSDGQLKKPKNELIYWVGAQWQFLRIAGPLSLGVDVGFFQDKAQARLAADPAKISEADENRFYILPVSLLVGYQFTLLADKTYIPLAPYIRAGLNYSFWWTREGDRSPVKNPQGEKVRGGVMGWQGIAGLALRLDDLSRRTARSIDARYGINHFSLFGEVMTGSTGWGRKGSINLGDSTYLAGVLIEF